MVNLLLKGYLWTRSTDKAKKALISWEQLCKPKAAGGLNFTDILEWNRAAISKLLWNLSHKKDKLWILKSKKYFEKAGYTYADYLHMPKFSIQCFYRTLQPIYPKVPWRKMICNNYGVPKWIFTFRVAAMGRLYTRDRLAKWGIANILDYPLCNNAHESIRHLYFMCPFSNYVWTQLLAWQGINKAPQDWEVELAWISRNTRKSGEAEIFRMVAAGCIYHIWKERNYRIFQAKTRTAKQVIKTVIQEVCYRGNVRAGIERRLRAMNFYPV
ncbi:uncharacterized protein LOC132062059 [Lycium ferocissimum]|uniref:uncharacterized protein LOC132062059 n=1 Tax=Lycium ferocissimum TaxID=112874 RepID=UPI002814DBBE|nr:uncharacterized protein LOC132062059 [Lycium ferocissimum]